VFRVLVTSGGGFQGQTVLDALRELPDVAITMVDVAEITPNQYLVDRFEQVAPVALADQYRTDLERICADEGIALILPSTDIEIEQLALARPSFEARGVRIAVSPPELLAVLRDKLALHEWLTAGGFPTLPLHGPPTAIEPTEFPLLGKPRTGWGGRDQLLIRSTADWDSLAESDRTSRVWQPYLSDFEEYSVDGAIGFDGVPSSWAARRRERCSGGFATVSRSCDDADLLELSDELGTALADAGACGAFNLQFLRSDLGLVASDLNPRIGTSASYGRGLASEPIAFLCRSAGYTGVQPKRDRPGPFLHLRSLRDEWVHDSSELAVSGIVFDLDDTLISQKAWIRSKLALLAAMKELPVEPQSFYAVARRLVEEGNRSHLFDGVQAAVGLSDSARDRLIALYRQTSPTSVELFPEVRSVLEAARKRGFLLGLVTDNPPDTQKLKLGLSGLADLFDATVFTRELGFEKPDPSGFAAASEAMGLDPAGLVSVGDNPFRDAEGSLRAGYDAAFWVRRRGSALNPSDVVVEELLGPRFERVRVVSDLRAMLAQLSVAREPPR